jgi:hypothetical protein
METYPQIFRVRQHFEARRVDDVEAEVRVQLGRLPLADRVAPGQSVAITAGSRGITGMARILRTAVEHLRALGAEPFIVPAMGSHGGGTAEGQRGVLEAYGITEAFVGCPIRSSLETVIVCDTPEGFAVHFDRLAYEADHVLVVNRVKPHTRFVGPIESGLMKMLLIGLGKCAGANVYHRAIEDYSFERIIHRVAGEVFRQCHILAGLAIVENAYDQTALIEAVVPEEFEVREKALLELARKWMPRLPFDEVDLLLVDRIGKNISGTGMDTNVIGRKFDDHKAAPGERTGHRRVLQIRRTPRDGRGGDPIERLDRRSCRRRHAAVGLRDRPAFVGRGAAGSEPGSPCGEDLVDCQHARSGRTGVFRGLLAGGPRTGRLGDHQRDAHASLRCGGQSSAVAMQRLHSGCHGCGCSGILARIIRAPESTARSVALLACKQGDRQTVLPPLLASKQCHTR